jgi:hypothetical protein
MDDLRVDQEVARLLDKAQIPMTEQWHTRVLAGVAKASPARPRRRRWTVALAGLAVVLVGLGFVPLPAGSAKGAFGRALALVNESPGVHVTGRIWGPLGEWRFEQWFTRGGFKRFDLSDGEQVVLCSLYDPGVRRIRPKWRDIHSVLATINRNTERTLPDLRGVWSAAPLIGPLADAYHAEREDIVPYLMTRTHGKEPTSRDFWQRIEEQKKTLQVRVEERQHYSVWGGKRAIADIYGHRREGAHVEVLILGNLMGSIYTSLGPGDDVWVHMEADTETGAILALQQYKRVEGRWKLVYCVDSIESGVEIGEEARNPALPEHHVEAEDTWWGERLQQTVAVGDSEDWRVTLHSLEANREGEVFLTLSREPRTEVTRNTFDQEGRPVPPHRTLWLEARDDLGTRYAIARRQGPDGQSLTVGQHGASQPPVWIIPLPAEIESHLRLRLLPESPRIPGRVPRTITLEITNEPAKSIVELTGVRSVPMDEYEAFDAWFRETYYQTITFARLPVPTPQGSGDLIEQAITRRER